MKRYQILRHDQRGFVWTNCDDLPYTVVRPMAFNDTLNQWADSELKLAEQSRLYDVIDWQTQTRGTIYRNGLHWKAKVYIWWWKNEYGKDANPHPAKAQWVSLHEGF
jgi:hypothetical protein